METKQPYKLLVKDKQGVLTIKNKKPFPICIPLLLHIIYISIKSLLQIQLNQCITRRTTSLLLANNGVFLFMLDHRLHGSVLQLDYPVACTVPLQLGFQSPCMTATVIKHVNITKTMLNILGRKSEWPVRVLIQTIQSKRVTFLTRKI